MTDLDQRQWEQLREAVRSVYDRHNEHGPLNHVNVVEWIEAVEPVIIGWMSDARTELLHPEFGSEWQEDGELRKAYESGVNAGKDQAYRSVLAAFERPPVWGPNENGEMMLDMSLDDFLADLKTVVFRDVGNDRHTE